jgi:hypothetical protein
MSPHLAPAELHRRARLDIHGDPAGSAADTLFCRHPWGTPRTLPADWRPMLLDPPGRFAPTAAWQGFRRTCEAVLQQRGGTDAGLAAFLAAVDELLAWRTGIPADRRIWDEE